MFAKIQNPMEKNMMCMYVRSEAAASGGCGDSNRFRPKPLVPSLVGPLPWVSYVCLVGQPLRGRWWGWWRNEGAHRGQCNRFPGNCLTTEENPRKPQLGNRRGAYSSATSHCFKWSPFPPNEVGRITLPAPLAKPIQVRPENNAEKNEI